MSTGELRVEMKIVRKNDGSCATSIRTQLANHRHTDVGTAATVGAIGERSGRSERPPKSRRY